MLLLGPERGAQLINQLPETAAVWVSSDGQSKLASTGPQILFANRVQSLTKTKSQP
jgi:hypothetical protein